MQGGWKYVLAVANIWEVYCLRLRVIYSHSTYDLIESETYSIASRMETEGKYIF